MIFPNRAVLCIGVCNNNAHNKPLVPFIKAVKPDYRVLFIERKLAVFYKVRKHLTVVIYVVPVYNYIFALVLRSYIAAVIRKRRSVHGIVSVIVLAQVILTGIALAVFLCRLNHRIFNVCVVNFYIAYKIVVFLIEIIEFRKVFPVRRSI